MLLAIKRCFILDLPFHEQITLIINRQIKIANKSHHQIADNPYHKFRFQLQFEILSDPTSEGVLGITAASQPDSTMGALTAATCRHMPTNALNALLDKPY